MNLNPRSWQGVLHTTLKFVSDLRQVGGFSPDIPAFSTNKSDCHDITKILLKVLSNTIKPNHPKLDLDVIHSGYKYYVLIMYCDLLIHVIIVYHWHWTGRIRGTLSSDQLIWKCNALLGHTKLISCSWDTWPEKLGRASEILFLYFFRRNWIFGSDRF
jgi:hypothetical protein